MIVRFDDLKVGDCFYCLGVKYIKIDDRKYGGRLSMRPANAIRLDNKHRVVMGNMVRVEKTEEVSEM